MCAMLCHVSVKINAENLRIKSIKVQEAQNNNHMRNALAFRE